MKISLTIQSDVEDADRKKEEIAGEIVAEEARALGETIRQRIRAQGVTDIEMSVKQSAI